MFLLHLLQWDNPLFSDTTCTPAAGWAKYLPCGTQSRTTVLWLGACWGPTGCKYSMRVVGNSTHSQTKTTSTQCCLSPRSIPRGMHCWVVMLLGACTCSLTEACGCFQFHGTKNDDLIRVHVFGEKVVLSLITFVPQMLWCYVIISMIIFIFMHLFYKVSTVSFALKQWFCPHMQYNCRFRFLHSLIQNKHMDNLPSGF